MDYIYRVEDGKENCIQTFIIPGNAINFAKVNNFPEVWEYKILEDENEEVVRCIWKDGKEL